MQCPHCLQNFHDTWTYTRIAPDKDNLWGLGFTLCPACRRLVVTLGHMIDKHDAVTGGREYAPMGGTFNLVYPKGISRSPIPSEVPPEFASDYREACLVLPDSEKASAALSRRCLQYLLREKAGIKKGDLANEIQQALDSKQLPEYLAEDLEAIRTLGNFAAHPSKSTNTGEIVDVEPKEAEWLLNLLEELFDFYFVQPARAKAKRDALNAKFQGAGRPPMKKPWGGNVD
jgi:hypothetical protein